MALQRICFLIAILAFFNVSLVPGVFPQEDDTYPTVHTSVGSIRGLRAEDGDYSMFLGVPYADVNKDNPFGNSLPYPRFEETFDAFDDSAICPQRDEFNQTLVGTLDCLHLNIFVPNSASAENPLPVIMWLYGGVFTVGYHNRFLYGARYLARHDVILVTVNYRLGPYGFMCLDIPEIPGNQGLKDQIKALRWVNEHIAAFGGDNSRITLGGNSAGAMSVDFHLHFGQEQLFHRIIPQSGVSIVYSAIRESSSPALLLQLAERFNYTPLDYNDAISFLATIPPLELIGNTGGIGFVNRPCIEKEFDGVESFITAHPVNLNVERVKDVDVLIGLTNDESYGNYANRGEEVLLNLDTVDEQLTGNFNFGEEYEHRAAMKEIVDNFYFGGNRTVESIPTIIDVVSDFYFNHPILRTAKKYLDNGAENLYLYMFSYVGGRNFGRIRNQVQGGGAIHRDELGYMFDISYMTMTPEDQLIVDRMTELWANFIKYGNPTPAATELNPFLWPRVTPDQWHYLEIDTEMTVGTRPKHQRMAFLDLFYKTNEEYQIGFEREGLAGNAAGRNTVLGISLPLLVAIKYFI